MNLLCSCPKVWCAFVFYSIFIPRRKFASLLLIRTWSKTSANLNWKILKVRLGDLFASTVGFLPLCVWVPTQNQHFAALCSFNFPSAPLLSDQNPSEMDALCPSSLGPSRPQRRYERFGEQSGTTWVALSGHWEQREWSCGCFRTWLVSVSQLQRFPDSDPHPKGEHRNRAAQFAVGCEECRSCGMCMVEGFLSSGFTSSSEM